MEKEMRNVTHSLETASLGDGWFQISKLILEYGQLGRDDGLPIREIAHLMMTIASPASPDPFLSKRMPSLAAVILQAPSLQRAW